jgi:hypothetical protein
MEGNLMLPNNTRTGASISKRKIDVGTASWVRTLFADLQTMPADCFSPYLSGKTTESRGSPEL